MKNSLRIVNHGGGLVKKDEYNNKYSKILNNSNFSYSRGEKL